MYDLKPRVWNRPTTYEMVRGLLSTGRGYSFALVKIKNAFSYDGGALVNAELKEVPYQVNLVIASLCPAVLIEWVTEVLPERKSLPFLIAVFMFFSITLMCFKNDVCLYVLIISASVPNTTSNVPLIKLAH